MRAVIIANGEVENYEKLKKHIYTDDFVICADGAIKHCIEMNIIPDLWIGDFDSCTYEVYCSAYSFLRDVRTIKLNPEKDVTDTHAACDIAIDLGYSNILILAGIGTRFDHTLSNIHLLEYLLKQGISAYVANERNTIRLFNDSITIKRTKKYLSIIPIDREVIVVETTGLKYMLKDYKLERFISLGVSNEITLDEAMIRIKGGLALAVQSED